MNLQKKSLRGRGCVLAGLISWNLPGGTEEDHVIL